MYFLDGRDLSVELILQLKTLSLAVVHVHALADLPFQTLHTKSFLPAQS